MIGRVFLLLSFLTPLFALGQDTSPENGELFLQNQVARIDITIHPDTLEWILDEENTYSNIHHRATFVYSRSGLSDTLQNVGFRLKGNTSREAFKKSFKISFNTFNQGGDFMGVEKINLNGEHNDVSLMRSKCNWDLLQESNLLGSRSSYVELYINDDYRGVYLNVEHIDEEFIDKRFDANSGNLYKCHYSGDLDFLSNTPDDYKFAPWGYRIYELKTNQEEDDYSDLAHFIDVLNNSSEEDLECNLESVFNVNAFLKTAAFEILIGHWDGYLYNMNNYYLYHNPADGLFYYISYDLDNTLGIDWLGVDWPSKNIYAWNDNSRPLIDRLLENDTYRNQFSFYVDEFISNSFTASNFNDRTQVLQDLISSQAEIDNYRTLDYGFTFEDFQESISNSWGGHVDYGISEYVSLRAAFAMDQIEDFTSHSLHVREKHLFDENHPVFFDTNQADEVAIEYSIDSETPTFMTLLDDGNNLDEISGDGTFTFFTNASGNQISIRARARYGNDWTDWSCEKLKWLSKDNSGLVINELMANNTSTIADEFGEYNDWAELYNGSGQAISLANKFLSNNQDELNKWALPSVTLEAGDFIIIWLDNDPEQGYNHSNFKLSASGDDLYLSRVQQGEWRSMDCIAFDGLAEDQVLARNGDAADEWVNTIAPTPGTSNLLTGINSISEAQKFSMYPIPAQNTVHFSRATSGQISSIDGKVLLSFENRSHMNIQHLLAGIYLVKTNFGTFRLVKN